MLSCRHTFVHAVFSEDSSNPCFQVVVACSLCTLQVTQQCVSPDDSSTSDDGAHIEELPVVTETPMQSESDRPSHVKPVTATSQSCFH